MKQFKFGDKVYFTNGLAVREGVVIRVYVPIGHVKTIYEVMEEDGRKSDLYFNEAFESIPELVKYELRKEDVRHKEIVNFYTIILNGCDKNG